MQEDENPLKRPFVFRRYDMGGIITLAILIVLVGGAKYAYRLWTDHRGMDRQEQELQQKAEASYRNFAASVAELEQQTHRRYSYPPRPAEATLVPFDPNTADSATFRSLGLPGWMARNIVRYREKGGRFRQPADLRKIYGMTDSRYKTLEPYIAIDATPSTPVTSREQLPAAMPPLLTAIRSDSPAHRRPDYPEKFPPGTIVDLNRADTTTLKRIPGIGSGIARLIVNYRQRLGGFYDLAQLREIHLDHNRLTAWLRIDTTAIRRINLNSVSLERLRRHPYFNFYQAKAIVEHRRREGRLQSLKPFILLEEFPKADLERISHYVCFE